MAYYTPREVLDANGKPTGKWHYTVAWGGPDGTRIIASGYCADGCPGHETKEEAYEHYRQYLIDHARYEVGEHATTAYRCQAKDCGAWTTGAVFVGGYEVYHLCDAHRNREHLASLVKVGNAWEGA